MLSEEFARQREVIESVIHTGQHYDYEMSRIFFDELALPEPDLCLDVGSAPHGAQTGDMLSRLEPILDRARPDFVLVYGDTNTTLAGALAAVKLSLPVVHVEAGLRSFDRTMPEEINRVVVDHISAVHFAPNENAVAQLEREGIRESVHRVGDLMVDLVTRTARRMDPQPEILRKLGFERGAYALATVHRAANTDDPAAFARIVAALRRLPFPVVFPVHPRCRALVEALAVGRVGDNIIGGKPVSYRQMVALEQHARVILTDSGGVQKEAFALGVPCVTLRRTTEWTETLRDGWNVLAGDDPDAIVAAAVRGRPGSPGGYANVGRCAALVCETLLRLHRGGAQALQQVDGTAANPIVFEEARH